MFKTIFLTSAYKSILEHNFFKSGSMFKKIFEKSPDGIVLIKNNRFLDCNKSIMTMFGFYGNKEEFLNTNLFALMPSLQPDGKSSTRKMIQMQKKAKKQTTIFEWLHTRKSGEKFLAEIALISIKIDQEEILYGTWRDISDRKRAELELAELNRTLEDRIAKKVAKIRVKDKYIIQQSRLAQMGEMISMIAHQWRQPLSAISATSSSIIIKAKLDKLDRVTAKELAEKIIEYSMHLSSTIDDFRNFFKTDKEKELISYNELIKSALNIIEISIINQNIELITKLNSKESIDTYTNEIKQVILNLIKNAEDVLLEKKIKNPQITIETSGNRLSISDNGGGISQEIIEKIFDPYFSTKLEKNGTGLGLYMSKIIVEEHCGGTLSVANDANGAVFTIML